jgi:murein DD-endopeptidase MepM/ murein hydrolase activator NlpD
MEGAVMKKVIFFFFLLLLHSTSSFSQQQGGEKFAQVINRLAGAINAGDYSKIIQEYNPAMVSAFPLNKTTIFFENIKNQYGKIVKIDSPQLKALDQAICLLYFEHGAQDINLYLDENGKIKGFLFTTHVLSEPQPAPATSPAADVPKTQPVNPPVSSEPKPARTPPPAQPAVEISKPAVTPKPEAPVITDKQQTELSLPFRGTWIVVPAQNSDIPSLLQQQYSFRFTCVDSSSGSRYRNEGKANEDFFGYGREILAPANGTVVEIINGVRDNSPGLPNSFVAVGNTIIIHHSSREYSVLSFLKQGSFRVKVGDRVTRGQVIALCGNSGGTKEPSLYYHLQDSPLMQSSKPVKFYFNQASIIKNGKKESASIYLPKGGDIISPE